MIPSFSRWRRRLDEERKDRPQSVRMAMNEASRVGEFLARYAPSGRCLILSERPYRAMPPQAQYGDA